MGKGGRGSDALNLDSLRRRLATKGWGGGGGLFRFVGSSEGVGGGGCERGVRGDCVKLTAALNPSSRQRLDPISAKTAKDDMAGPVTSEASAG